ncbi:transposase [Parvularcula dongshanensis]|uniref:Transposase n=1 Tax=Parvularcula dongshanensis TaxID=1173995 RepID=A0A840I8H0_9PROT|nr:ISNCY family transposase [Parvularcula dongshanensis]MBB4660250.1 transposase [Parvularcula dongshanensis]
MGLVIMSERELKRIETIGQMQAGRLKPADAASILGVSERTVFRIAAKLKTHGAASFGHGLRGRPSNRKLDDDKREYILGLVRRQYDDFGPTLAAEMLADRDGVTVSKETLRKWMIAEGMWTTRKARRRIHQPRLRRERVGELVQIDGSPHRWFEDRGPSCSLIVFVDDATSRLLHLHFCESESTASYFDATEAYLTTHGRPLAFYSDKHTVFRLGRKSQKSGHGMTQFGRAMSELSIEIICADTPQAKGRVERANRTLQDRLVKLLRLEGIDDMQAGNAYAKTFVTAYNDRFAKPPAKSDDLHRPLAQPPYRLREVLCVKSQRRVTKDITLRHDNTLVILERNEVSDGLPGKWVDVHDYADGRIEVRWKGASLPFKQFDKRQGRTLHTSITENKHLTAAVERIKAQRDNMPAPATYRPSAKNGYVSNGRRQGHANGTSILKLKQAKRQREAEAAATAAPSEPSLSAVEQARQILNARSKPAQTTPDAAASENVLLEPLEPAPPTAKQRPREARLARSAERRAKHKSFGRPGR